MASRINHIARKLCFSKICFQCCNIAFKHLQGNALRKLRSLQTQKEKELRIKGLTNLCETLALSHSCQVQSDVV
jgi:hypothetical protein